MSVTCVTGSLWPYSWRLPVKRWEAAALALCSSNAGEGSSRGGLVKESCSMLLSASLKYFPIAKGSQMLHYKVRQRGWRWCEWPLPYCVVSKDSAKLYFSKSSSNCSTMYFHFSMGAEFSIFSLWCREFVFILPGLSAVKILLSMFLIQI